MEVWFWDDEPTRLKMARLSPLDDAAGGCARVAAKRGVSFAMELALILMSTASRDCNCGLCRR